MYIFGNQFCSDKIDYENKYAEERERSELESVDVAITSFGRKLKNGKNFKKEYMMFGKSKEQTKARGKVVNYLLLKFSFKYCNFSSLATAETFAKNFYDAR